MKKLSWQKIFLSLGLVLCLVGSASAADPWPLVADFTDLGILGAPEGSSGESYGTGINDFGQVVGWSSTNIYGVYHAFLWSPGQGMQDLGTPTGENRSYGAALNNTGQIAVNYFAGGTTAYLYFQGSWTKLATLADWCESVAGGINQAGYVAGRTYVPGANWRACYWSPAGALQTLGTLGGTASEAAALNAYNWVVGNSRTPEDTLHAFLWKPGGEMQDLGCLPGDTYSVATGINDSGWIVGYSWGQFERAVMWSPGGQIQELGFLPDGWSSHATAINNSGQVTGWSNARWNTGFNIYEVTHAFFYANGQMQDLGTLDKNPLRGSWGYAINNRGQAAGKADSANGLRAFLATLRSAIPPVLYLLMQ